MTITFNKATKQQLKGRIALAGPTGSGKTWTALEIAKVLGTTAVLIDTEQGSGALYADTYDYDYFRFDPPYEPARLVAVLKEAEAQGYEVVIVDSLSHFWEGEGGTLDIADAAGQRSGGGNSFAGWKVATPQLRHLVDTLLGIDAHLLVTMRSKMEYVLEENERGKKVPRKVGMAPVMRQGVEYEFTLVGDLDFDHRMVISKSRCSVLADQVVQPNRAGDMAETFKTWLGSGEPLVTREQATKLMDALNAIEADDPTSQSRKVSKELFMDAYGLPERLAASKFDAALAFAQERSTIVAPPPETPAVDPTVVRREVVAKDNFTEAKEGLKEILGLLTPEAVQDSCTEYLLSTMGHTKDMTLDQLNAACKIAAGWPGTGPFVESEPEGPESEGPEGSDNELPTGPVHPEGTRMATEPSRKRIFAITNQIGREPHEVITTVLGYYRSTTDLSAVEAKKVNDYLSLHEGDPAEEPF